MEFFQIAILILFGLAISDLIVGVSNDAVNFLNSSIGSKVAPRNVIMIIASLGMLAGVTFSSGMMEVARKGIFHPQFFTMPELMTIFLAVMLTDILLLDLYNTFGLPTSTTVSIVFELLGAAVAVSLLKLYTSGDGLGRVLEYINTGKALTIIFGILLSVVVAFAVGALVQFISRIIFTFDYEKRLRRYGALWGGVALSSITYFILIKGSKGASFITPEVSDFIKGNTWLILLGSFGVCAVLLQILLSFTRVSILKVIVLIGTFALAMAFAANDLVNFIGVPLAGLSSYQVAAATSDPMNTTMEALAGKVPGNTALLIMAGVIMVITLWVSRKARSVTKTEIRLGRQDEGFERFESTVLSQTIVRLVSSIFDSVGRLFPRSLRGAVNRRFDRSTHRPTPGRRRCRAVLRPHPRLGQSHGGQCSDLPRHLVQTAAVHNLRDLYGGHGDLVVGSGVGSGQCGLSGQRGAHRHRRLVLHRHDGLHRVVDLRHRHLLWWWMGGDRDSPARRLHHLPDPPHPS